MAPEFTSPKILQKVISMCGALVGVRAVPFTRTRVAIPARGSSFCAASLSVSWFIKVFESIIV